MLVWQVGFKWSSWLKKNNRWDAFCNKPFTCQTSNYFLLCNGTWTKVIFWFLNRQMQPAEDPSGILSLHPLRYLSFSTLFPPSLFRFNRSDSATTSPCQSYHLCQTLKLFPSLLLSAVISVSYRCNPPPPEFPSSTRSTELIRSPASNIIHPDLQPLLTPSPPPVASRQLIVSILA